MVDEKVTVISSVVRTYIHTKAKLVEMGSVLTFLLLKLGTPSLAALGNIHEGDSHILK